MALSKPLLSLITDGQGNALTDFITSTPEQWADRHMPIRYSTVRLETDDPNSFAVQCWKQLCTEHEIFRSWFTDDGKLSVTLKSASMQNKLTGPIGDGIGWDYKTNGDVETRMLFFKSTLIAASRAAALLPPQDRHSGNAQFGGLVKFIQGAYSMRAEIHRWRSIDVLGTNYTPSDMSRRWIAMQTFSFLLRIGADNRKWAWEASKCLNVFGPFDDTEVT